MANNEPTAWLKDFIIPHAYTATKEEIEKLQSQRGKTELIEKHNVVSEIDNDNP